MVGTLGLAALSRNLFQTTAVVQDLDVRIKSLTKVVGDYDAVQHFLTETADKQHKSIESLSDGYAKLRLLQNSNVISGSQTKAMIGLNDAASALGATNVQLTQVYFGLAQGLSSPTLKAEELNQVMEPLPGLLQAMDKAVAGTGDVVAGAFRQMVLNGQVTSEVFAKILVKALKSFEGQAEATGDNINAKLNDVKNQWFQLASAIQDQGAFSSAVNTVLDLTDAVLESATSLFESDKAESVRYLSAFKDRLDEASESVDNTAKVYQKMMGTFGSDEALTNAIQEQKKYKAALAKTIEEARSFGVTQGVINSILFEGETATETFTRKWDDLSTTYQQGKIKQDEYEKSLRILVDTLNGVSQGSGVNSIESSVQKITDALDKDIKKLSMSGREYFIWSNHLEEIDPLLKTNALRLYDQKSALEGASKAQDEYRRRQKEASRELEARNKLLQQINTLAAPKKSTEKIDFSSVGSGGLEAITAQAEDNIDALQQQMKAIVDVARANQFSEQVNKSIIVSQKQINAEIANNTEVLKASTAETDKRTKAQKRLQDGLNQVQDSLEDELAQLTMTSREYFIYSSNLKNAKSDQREFMLSEYDQIAALKDHKKALEEIRDIDDAVFKFDTEALDLGDFGGLAGDINSIAMAFDSMSSSLSANADFIQQNKQAWDDYTASTADVGKERSKNIEKFAKREQALIRQTTQIQLQGSSDMLGGVSNMLNSMAALQDEGSKKQIQYQKAAMVVEGAAAVVKGVSAVMTALRRPLHSYSEGGTDGRHCCGSISTNRAVL